MKASSEPDDAPPLELSCAELKSRLDAGEDLLLVDCREPEEHAIGVLTDAVLAPLANLPERVAELSRHEGALVVYCHHGVRSLRAATWLRANGVPHAQSLAGGIDAWAREVDPSTPRY